MFKFSGGQTVLPLLVTLGSGDGFIHELALLDKVFGDLDDAGVRDGHPGSTSGGDC